MGTLHKTIEQRLTEFYGVPLDQIPYTEQEEINWGDDRGAEILPDEDIEYYRELLTEIRI